MTQESEIQSDVQKKIDKEFKEGMKHTIKSIITLNKSSLMKLIMEVLENQKSEYAFYGADETLDFLVCGMQIACQNTLLQIDNKRIVLQSFLRLEDVPVSQQAGNTEILENKEEIPNGK